MLFSHQSNFIVSFSMCFKTCLGPITWLVVCLMQMKVTIICDHLAHRPRGAHSYHNTDPGNAAQASISLWQKHQWNLPSACAAGPLGHVLLGDPFPPPATIPAKRSSVSSICLFMEWFKCDKDFQECLDFIYLLDICILHLYTYVTTSKLHGLGHYQNTAFKPTKHSS